MQASGGGEFGRLVQAGRRAAVWVSRNPEPRNSEQRNPGDLHVLLNKHGLSCDGALFCTHADTCSSGRVTAPTPRTLRSSGH